jgi:Bacterial SH3 domain
VVAAVAIAAGALAQAGSTGGSIGNDEKSITGSRLEHGRSNPSQEGGPADCVVADPTPAPLNIRTAPNGKIAGTISNGERVRILNEAQDPHDKQWAYIENANSKPLGWVFGDTLVAGSVES